MLTHPRVSIAIVLTLLCSASPAPSNEKPQPKGTGPVIPSFVRFHQDAKADSVKGGQLLLGELNCISCHAPDAAMEGVLSRKSAPILDGIGGRVKRRYLREFLSDPHKTKPGTTMPNVFAGLEDKDKEAKVEALVHFLASTGTATKIRPDGKGVAAGRDLFAKVGCVACHGTRTALGDQDKLFMTSVPLGNLKAKYTLASLKAFLENPHQTRPSARMPGLLNAKEASDVANYLMQGAVGVGTATNMHYAYYEGAWTNLPNFAKLKPKATGQATDFDLSVARRLNDCALKFDGFVKFAQDGDYTFHVTSDDGSRLWIDGDLVVNNDGVHPPLLKSGKVKLAQGVHKLTVGVFNAGGGFELGVEVEGPGLGRQPLGPLVYPTEKAIDAPPVVDKKNPDQFKLQPELIAQGKELFSSMGCVNCHQLQKEKVKVDAPALAKLNADRGCLEAAPKKGIPWFGLNATQLAALRAALKTPAPAKLEAKERIARTMSALNCYACHERDKIGGVEEDLNKHFTSPLQEWGDEARVPPSLSGVGAKMNPAYFKKIIEQGAHDRPYMNTRMPRFGAAAINLVELCGNVDKIDNPPKVTLAEPMQKVKAAGRHMVGRQEQAFGCINCHNFGGVKTEGVQGIDMAIMAERLKKEWFYHYLVNPIKYRAGTRMPSPFSDGKTLLTKVLDGTQDAQIEAIWLYLADGKKAALPIGLSNSAIPLVPKGEAIIYRNFIQGAGPRAIGVGYPEKAHLAFDANELRLAMIWQGAFIDARRHWTDRGVGYEPPLGDNVMHLPAGVSFFVLEKDDETWPTKVAKELGYKFRGYRLTDDQRPTFLYSFNGINFEDFANAVEVKNSPTIRRAFTLTTDNPIDKLYYRAAVADKIEADKDGWFRINDWRMRIEADATPVIRRSGKAMELLVPVRFKGKSAKIVQEYHW